MNTIAPTGLNDVSLTSRLSSLEDEQVVLRARAGCPQATEFLLRKYRNFVEVKARSYFLAGADQEDVVQEGMIGLFKAIRDYRGDRLAQFRSFAELCITRQIITAVKSATRHKHALMNDYVSLQRSYGEDSDGCLMDIVADSRATDPERILLDRQMVQCLNGGALDDLSDLEYEVLQGYLDGRTYEAMSARLGRPMKAIDNALQRAKRKAGRKLCELN